MDAHIYLGRGLKMLPAPEAMWKKHLTQTPDHSHERLKFMTEAHHQVRYFVVQELLNQQKPIEPELISEALQMPLEQVQSLLDELERELFFLVRNEQNQVAWAYPVTVEKTPHKLKFSSGEQLYGA